MDKKEKDWEQVQSANPKREDQEHDARLAESARLVAEMDRLAASARLLAEMESLLDRAKSRYLGHIENLKKLNST
ncbi:MAG TPA: hypothetical protein VFT23_00950 [Burkholderiales bacterium]|nr:hypothetical protein [Burkholderiales bacterium]